MNAKLPSLLAAAMPPQTICDDVLREKYLKPGETSADDVLRRVRAKPAHRASLLAEGRLSRSELAALLAHGPPRRAAGHRVARA